MSRFSKARRDARRKDEPARPIRRLGDPLRLQARLAADDLPTALALVGEHARRFPDGALVDVREAARVDALCRGGEADRADAAARDLSRAHPGSAVAQRFANFRCAR